MTNPSRSPVNAPGVLPLTAAHRGYSSVTPENSLAAYAAAARTGAEYVEIDVQTTADGVPVVMHDTTVDRTTNGSGDIASLASDRFTSLDAGSWFSPAFTGQQAPTFRQMLDLIAASASGTLLEIKADQTRAEVYRIVDMVLDAGVGDRTVIQSFDEDALRYTRERAPQVPLGLLRGTLDDDPVAAAAELGVDYYNPSGAALATRPSIVADLHAAGVGVFVWIIDDADHWERLTALGVDGIITDRPDAFIGWKAARAQAEPERRLLVRLAEAALAGGEGRQLLSALGRQDRELLAAVVEQRVGDPELRARLLAKAAGLAG